MSRILPIKKSLDDRFINETNVITEQALTQVIEGQGDTWGASGVYFNYAIVQAMVDYYNKYVQSGHDSSLYKTKSEMAALMNITEEQLEQLVRGQVKCVEYEFESYGSIYCKLIPLREYRVRYVGGEDDEYHDAEFADGNLADSNKLNINETSDGMFFLAFVKLSNWN